MRKPQDTTVEPMVNAFMLTLRNKMDKPSEKFVQEMTNTRMELAVYVCHILNINPDPIWQSIMENTLEVLEMGPEDAATTYEDLRLMMIGSLEVLLKELKTNNQRPSFQLKILRPQGE